MKKRILSVLITVLTVVALVQLSAVTVFAIEDPIIVTSIEIEAGKPVIGEAPTKPTVKSVNDDENLKDLVSFFSDSKVYWVEADSAEDIANGNKNPTVFADGKIYALHVAIQSTKEIAEDCVLNVYGTDGELLWSGNISFSDSSDKTLVYTDAFLGNFKHTHAFSTDFKTDAENHWKECACGAKSENGAHSGGTATCTAKAKCEICQTEYGSVAGHAYGIEFKTDAENHWKECACGDKANVAPHVDTDSNGKCDSCNYLLVDVTPIYDVKLILNNYAVGKKVSDINVIVPAGAKYKVVSFEVRDVMSGDLCAPTDVIAMDKGYVIDVELEADLGYKIEELNSLMDMCPNVTLNGIMGYKDGWNNFRFFMPNFTTSTTPYPKGEIKLNGYQLGAMAKYVRVTMPDGYEIYGGPGGGFMFFDAYTEDLITEFGADFYAVAIVFYPNSDYDSSTFSKDTLTLFGQEAEFVIQTPMNYQVVYYLPLAPAATDIVIEKVELKLNGYGIGANTSIVTVTANDYTGIDVLEGCFIEDSLIWTKLEGGIEAGKKYLYQVGIAASEGFTLSSIRPETFTLNGKAPVDFCWEEGFLVATFELDALGTTPGTDDPTTPDDPSDDKDGLGAGAIVGIVIGSVLVVGVGGFALFWFVIKKKSFAELIAVFKKN